MMLTDREAQLGAVIEAIGPLALALSGGVDSMTLAHMAQARLGNRRQFQPRRARGCAVMPRPVAGVLR